MLRKVHIMYLVFQEAYGTLIFVKSKLLCHRCGAYVLHAKDELDAHQKVRSKPSYILIITKICLLRDTWYQAILLTSFRVVTPINPQEMRTRPWIWSACSAESGVWSDLWIHLQYTVFTL